MRRSTVEEYLNAPTARVPEVRQAYGRTTQSFMEQEARRVAANAAANDDLLRSYRERVGANPTASFRSAAAPQEDQGRVPQPYAGVGVGAREDPGGGGPPEEREPQEYAGAPGGRYNPYEGMAPPPGGGGGDEWDEANYPPAGTGPPRGPGGAPPPQPAPQHAPQPTPAPFENTDEYTGDMPGVSAPLEHSSAFVPQHVPAGLPPPYDSPESIIATFGQVPNKSQIKRAYLQYHPDRSGDPTLFQNISNAINNAYRQVVVGQGKRRKYRY